MTRPWRSATARAQLDSTTRLLEALGPAPAEGEPAEAETVARQRAQFNEDIAFYKGRIAQADLATARAEELDRRIAVLTREQRVERLLVRSSLPLARETLGIAVPEAGRLTLQLTRAPVAWYAGISDDDRARLGVFTLAGIAVTFAAWLLRRLLRQRLRREPVGSPPPYGHRALMALADGLGRVLVPVAALGALWVGSEALGPTVSGLVERLLEAALLAILVFALSAAAIKAALAPGAPGWSLLPVAREHVRRVTHWAVALAAVFAADQFVTAALHEVVVSPALAAVQDALGGLLLALPLLALARALLWRPDPAAAEKPDPDDVVPEAAEPPAPVAEGGGQFWGWVRWLAIALVMAGLVAHLVGFGYLGRFLIGNVVLTAPGMAAMYVLRHWARYGIGLFLRSALVRERLSLSHRSRRMLKFWLRALLDPVIVAVWLVLIIPLWGVPQADLYAWTIGVLRGFSIGDVTVSIADIGLAILLFLAGFLLTRLAQRGLSDHVLPETTLDSSVQHSLVAGAGYVGVLIAGAVGIAALGIDLTNIALVAGALSVGIGFGLQNIVNNFVSGLILLVERPIKVGDWVVVGGHEGFVRRISVRAPELETFERASVLIPNAEIIQNAVVNWTHKDRVGRVDVAVGVAYGSDTERVREILLEVAREHPRTLPVPEPFVLLRNFGASSLDFEVRCFTSEVILRAHMASDLRLAIDRRFREAGIEIPFPQQVVHAAQRGA